MKKKILVMISLIFTTVFINSYADASLIESWDFDNESEYGLFDNQWNVYGSILDWTGEGSGIEIQRNTVVSAHSGNYYVELDSHKGKDTNSSMFSDIYLNAGNYKLSFQYHARTNKDDDNGIRGLIDDAVIGSVSKKLSDMNSVWEEITWSFLIPEQRTYRLMFSAYGDSNTLGGFIDSVEIHANPEPTTFLLLGFGLLGLAGVGRRKK